MHNALKAYQQSQVQRDVNPIKLIHMAYEGILTYLLKAEEGIDESNIQKRGESLSKAIALIAELNVAVQSEEKAEDEASLVLRGLYESILTELPRVALTEDKEILHRTYRYIAKLKEVWEETAMKEHALPHSPAAYSVETDKQNFSGQFHTDPDGYAAGSGISTSI